MEKLNKWLRLFFDTCDKWQARISQKWDAHANRRTSVVIATVGIAATLLYVSVIQPPDRFPVGELVTVPDHASLSDVSNALKDDGVVRSALVFRLIVIALGHERSVHAGDYLFKEPRNIFSIARAISIGAFGLEPEKIRIPEGATTRSMAIIYANRLLRFDPQRFLEKAQPQEGYLFPDTYYFLPNATEETVINTMRQNFDSKVAQITPPIASSTHSLPDTIAMASIVEKEARTPEDRRLIAGVLWNRLKRGMPLQVDVTFLYTLGKGTFQLTMQDLQSDSPYNTYKHAGLPPGPINSPSLDAIDAAVHPTKTDYLYYLADFHGVTHYSKTYQQHLRYKRIYLGT